MRFVLEIECDNDAFSTGGEVARLLREAAEDIEEDDYPNKFSGKSLYDANGNRVGGFKFEEN